MELLDSSASRSYRADEERGTSFEEAIFHIQTGGLLDDISHPNAIDHPNQKIFVIAIDGYAYLVPYVENDDEIFLKTVIPSRKFTKLYLRGDS
ncbi:MAG: toxin [Gammaproteobacteria bacterium]|nr:toxin [Gammaproteobacteria bacterium]